MSYRDSFDSEADNEDTEATVVASLTKQDIELLLSLSKTLSQVVNENKKLNTFTKIVKEQSPMIFSASTPPTISLYDYLYRIKYYTEVANSSLILAMIYIDRLCLNGELILTQSNIHRILFGGIICAVKYNEDTFFDNKFYAEVAGVSLKELNKIETDFVDLIGFNFFVDKTEFNQYEKYLKVVNKK